MWGVPASSLAVPRCVRNHADSCRAFTLGLGVLRSCGPAWGAGGGGCGQRRCGSWVPRGARSLGSCCSSEERDLGPGTGQRRVDEGSAEAGRRGGDGFRAGGLRFGGWAGILLGSGNKQPLCSFPTGGAYQPRGQRQFPWASARRGSSRHRLWFRAILRLQRAREGTELNIGYLYISVVINTFSQKSDFAWHLRPRPALELP